MKKLDYPDWKLIDEPVAKWRKAGKENIMDLNYKDPKRWAFTMQTNVVMTEAELFKSESNLEDANVKIFERSIQSSRYVYAPYHHEMGNMNEVEWETYLNLADFFLSKPEYQLDGIIYIRTSPSICADRVRKRSRSDEELNSVDLGHLKSADSFHEKWLQNDSKPVLVLDFDGAITNQMEVEIVNKITKFLGQIQN